MIRGECEFESNAGFQRTCQLLRVKLGLAEWSQVSGYNDYQAAYAIILGINLRLLGPPEGGIDEVGNETNLFRLWVVEDDVCKEKVDTTDISNRLRLLLNEVEEFHLPPEGACSFTLPVA